ncbi:MULTISPECIES: 5'-methylthioadenosine/S-adenosylhomocysteine nucleosidase family protein [Prauserella salsuginis group]|uniref:Nucleoside phosphorylase n=2 Tax=Prauserella salsuginis group TaxID=2893672 RepID=A0A839XM77_9PSEU|nr:MULTISPECIES: 5'-methylthioadenosine/S-adenosylhomocysteine nucleosidase [Prauserella salsuginis group]MBB3664972.1 nucleoside phosphorylase [Prauserella sediminis]
MLTALDLEYDAVRNRLSSLRSHPHDKGTRFEVGTIPGTTHRIALGLADKGNHKAAVMAERALTEFEPLAVLFIGVAGGLWNTPLGDVVIASKIYAYHGGTSEDDGLKARPESWQLDHRLSQLVHQLKRDNHWVADIGRDEPGTAPTAHIAPIAAGEIVQNSSTSHEATWLRQHYNDARAVEMEAAGVAQAGQLSGVPVAVVRGISDHADGTKATTSDSAWQPVAADHAAAFGVRLASELATEQEHSTMTQHGNPNAHYVQKVGNGSVAIQGSTVTNNSFSTDATAQTIRTVADFRREIMSLRSELRHLQESNQIDTDTADAAEAELNTAGTTLSDPSTTKKSFILALKRFQGLVGNISEVAARVATMIAAAEGLA